MRVLSVNVGKPREVPYRAKTVSTGIFKTPVSGRVIVRKHNLDGDAQADLQVHGGPNKALYAYPAEHYAFWRTEIPEREFPFGLFGENLTVEGLDESVEIGDRFKFGTAILMVTQPRLPCYKLGIRMASQSFVRRFLESGKTGFYLAVVEEGTVAAGDPIEAVSHARSGLSVAAMTRMLYDDADRDQLERASALELLPAAWRAKFLQRLKEAEVAR